MDSDSLDFPVPVAVKVLNYYGATAAQSRADFAREALTIKNMERPVPGRLLLALVGWCSSCSVAAAPLTVDSGLIQLSVSTTSGEIVAIRLPPNRTCRHSWAPTAAAAAVVPPRPGPW